MVSVLVRGGNLAWREQRGGEAGYGPAAQGGGCRGDMFRGTLSSAFLTIVLGCCCLGLYSAVGEYCMGDEGVSRSSGLKTPTLPPSQHVNIVVSLAYDKNLPTTYPGAKKRAKACPDAKGSRGPHFAQPAVSMLLYPSTCEDRMRAIATPSGTVGAVP